MSEFLKPVGDFFYVAYVLLLSSNKLIVTGMVLLLLVALFCLFAIFLKSRE